MIAFIFHFRLKTPALPSLSFPTLAGPFPAPARFAGRAGPGAGKHRAGLSLRSPCPERGQGSGPVRAEV